MALYVTISLFSLLELFSLPDILFLAFSSFVVGSSSSSWSFSSSSSSALSQRSKRYLWLGLLEGLQYFKIDTFERWIQVFTVPVNLFLGPTHEEALDGLQLQYLFPQHIGIVSGIPAALHVVAVIFSFLVIVKSTDITRFVVGLASASQTLVTCRGSSRTFHHAFGQLPLNGALPAWQGASSGG